jgi:hypothetical protein
MNDRLRDAIGTYCLQTLDEVLIEDLTHDVQHGSLGWFPDEFGAAIPTGEFTPRRWGQLTDVLMEDDDDHQLDEYLRLVWSRAAPHPPYMVSRRVRRRAPSRPFHTAGVATTYECRDGRRR